MNGTLTLRPATMADADITMEWRNDPDTRKSSRNTSPVEREEHLVWLACVLADSNRQLLIAQEAGVPVGTVRADLSGGVWELSWTTAPQARGRGVAKQMVALAAGRISGPVRAEIKKNNPASARIAEYAGMDFIGEENGVLHYRRNQ
ncbi:MAG: GNAT family N-acetyltransferase [Desulfobacter sp.]|nr:MAG: GNAT family N-acetyltransferase [Desulfobacter sp.]